MAHASGLSMDKAILIAEDDDAVRALLSETLSDVDGRLITAVKNGNQAITALDTLHPDLVMLDVHMPGKDGLEVYRLLRTRASLANVPVLFVSAEIPTCAKDLQGMFYWLTKPFDLDDLEALVADLLADAPTAPAAALHQRGHPEQ